MSISVRRVRKTRYQSTSWEHDDVPIADDGWTETNIQAFAEELKSEDIALVLHHRQPPKPLADAIAASGARLVVVDTEAADPVAGLESDMKAIVEGLLAGKG